MSNIDKMTANEQLFTELTPEEGAVIEGGATLVLIQAMAIKAGADLGFWNGDDVYATINGRVKTRQTNDVDTGEFANIYKTWSFIGTAEIDLFDNDPWPNRDDHLGGFTVRSTDLKGLYTERVSGSGSRYVVTYMIK